MLGLREEVTTIDRSDRNYLIGFFIVSFISSYIGRYLCENIPKPENLKVMWEYFKRDDNKYMYNFLSVLAALVFSCLFLYRIYIILNKHMSSDYNYYGYYGEVSLNILSIVAIVIYSLYTIYSVVYFATYLIKLLWVPAIALGICWIITSDGHSSRSH